MKKIKFSPSLMIALIGILLIGLSCNNTKKSKINLTENEAQPVKKVAYDTLSPRSLLLAVREACGGMELLKSLGDVAFDYHYVSADGTSDISQERYIFDGEVSWAKYNVHEINVSPDLDGSIVQFYDGQSVLVYQDGKPLDDPTVLGTGQFLRQANYMWFTMMFKLTDPGILYTFKGRQEKDDSKVDVVHITYDPEVTGKEQNDTYILHINPETRMVESFYFSLPAFGVNEPVLHAQLTYTNIDGIMVITRRVMTGPSADGKEMVLMVDQQSKNVTFNNGFTAEQLGKEL